MGVCERMLQCVRRESWTGGNGDACLCAVSVSVLLPGVDV